ncbi:MAG: hypothetical protein AAF487_13195 [Bacteroidota bacterium]
MNDFRVSFNKYVFPVILLTLGVILIATGLKQLDYDARLYRFLIGAIGVFGVGMLSLYYSMDKISAKTQKIVMIPALVLCAYLLFANYQTINENIVHKENLEDTRTRVIQKFKDIRTAQQAYKEMNGTYTTDFNQLIDFVKNGQFPIYKNIGSIPDSIDGGFVEAMELGLIVKMPEGMTDEEAETAGLIVRDTIYASVLDEKFNTPKELEKRKYPLNVDSLRYSPYQGEFRMRSSQNDEGRPTLLVSESVPYPGSSFPDTLMLGALSQAHLNGNWKE